MTSNPARPTPYGSEDLLIWDESDRAMVDVLAPSDPAIPIRVYKTGEVQPDLATIQRMLDDLGVSGEEYSALDLPVGAEGLIVYYGRLCYMSFGTSLNPNITQIRGDSQKYVANLLRSEHGSVFEHVTVNFEFSHVSRVFTHELVRHRVGTAISQESLRYKRIDSFKYSIPPEIKEADLEGGFVLAMDYLMELQRELAARVDLGSMNFDQKKRLTSALRRLAPIGMGTHIGWSANLRTLRHVIPMRTSPQAEWEMRVVFDLVARLCKFWYPLTFQDFRVSEDNLTWTAGHWED